MTDSSAPIEEQDEFEPLTPERLAEIAELADAQDDELAFGTLEVIEELLAVQDALVNTQSVLVQFANAFDTMCLVAEQANDMRVQRLIDASLIRAGLLVEGQSAFSTSEPAEAQ
jgi:hypothetical protein